MRRLFDAVVRATFLRHGLCGREIWPPAGSLLLGPELKDMLGVQLTLLRQLCNFHKKSVMLNIMFRDFSERLWPDTWGAFLLRLSTACRCCLMTACIWIFSRIILLMPGPIAVCQLG